MKQHLPKSPKLDLLSTEQELRKDHQQVQAPLPNEDHPPGVLTDEDRLLDDDVLVKREYDKLIQSYLSSNHRKKISKIEKAFRLANEAHKGAKRKSGEPYILHPISVAQIVSQEMGLGSTSICCALLHDVVEDTDYTVGDLKELFGEKIATIVDGLTKISGEVFSDSSMQTENFRKLILTMNDDIRVILVKIADRLHNMRTLGSMLPAKQMKICSETAYIYAPLAHRLGLFAIKSELEDLSFKYEHPTEYEMIRSKIYQTNERRQEKYDHFASPLKSVMDTKGFKYEMRARIKGLFSIWNKMQTKNVPFEEIYDVFAVRIIFDSTPDYPDKNRCWDIYSIITDIYQPRPERLRDWVSNSKSNGYQALHLTVMGPDGDWVEIQIRSRKMDDIAEKGFAAHWKYKTENVEEDSALETWLGTIREILEDPNPDAMDFLDTVKLNLFANEIMVFTPKGDPIKLPLQATVLDFAYAIHTTMGHRCMGAKVNHRLVPISYILQAGDQVEILVSNNKDCDPSEEWLKFVATAKARSKISEGLQNKRRRYIKKGEEAVMQLASKNGITISTDSINQISTHFGFINRDEFFCAVGKGDIKLPEEIKKIFQKNEGGNIIKRTLLRAIGAGIRSNATKDLTTEITPQTNEVDYKKTYVLKEGELHRNYAIADCCNPIPGDDVFGFVNDRNQVVVHKRLCPIALRLKTSAGNRILSTAWSEHVHTSFEATLSIRGLDSRGILNAITEALTNEFEVNICDMQLKAKDGIFEGRIKIYVHNADDVKRICDRLKHEKSIKSVGRIAE